MLDKDPLDIVPITTLLGSSAALAPAGAIIDIVTNDNNITITTEIALILVSAIMFKLLSDFFGPDSCEAPNKSF
jgi:hypothetical protein